MQEQPRYAVGIDVGTKTVRAVVAHIDGVTGAPKIVGVGTSANSGMKKGVVSNLTGPASAIDLALEQAERMSGFQVEQATFSINGSHILSTKADGMVAVGSQNNEVSQDDISRLEEVAMTGKVPANREILEVVPHSYRLDGQDNIKNPIGMSGTRLEMRANVVSCLAPHVANIQKVAEMLKVQIDSLVPSVLASAQAVLSESQMDNGVAVVDIGASTTGVAVFEEGDLQYVSVIPVGSQNVTNDLAIGLKVDPEIAEEVKLAHARFGGESAGEVETKIDKQVYKFAQSEIDEIVEARFEEIFEAVNKELKRAGVAGKLPSGVVLVGGGSKVKNLADFAKEQLGLAVRQGVPRGFVGVSEEVSSPEFASSVGLMLIDATERATKGHFGGSSAGADKALKKAGGFFGWLLAKFR